MSMEQYQPTSEEMSRAKGMMGAGERIMSHEREARTKVMESLKAQGYLEVKEDYSATDEELDKDLKEMMANGESGLGSGTAVQTMEGVVNGKTLSLRRLAKRRSGNLIPTEDDKEGSFTGTVESEDGTMELTHQEAKQLFAKFFPAAADVKRTGELMEQVKGELEGKGEQARKQEEQERRKKILGDLL
jgi:hypothetical protein